MMENEMFDLVSLAQNGDKEALAMVLFFFYLILDKLDKKLSRIVCTIKYRAVHC